MGRDRSLLADALEAAALLEGLAVKRQGGTTPEQADRARADLNAAPFADVLMFGGDTAQLRAAFTANANALAVLANAPGGVKFAGRRIDLTGLWEGQERD